MLRRTARTEVDEFIAARSDALLRTACLLTGDRERGESLLQATLAEVWATWDRSELGPDLTARRAMLRVHGRWWRRRHAPAEAAGDRSRELLHGLERLSRRQRAALVLTDADRLPEADVAEVLECSPATVSRLLVSARARMAVDDPAAALEMVAGLLLGEGAGDGRVTVARRLDEVAHRVDVRRAWRRTEALASLFAATVAMVTVVATFPSADVGHAPDRPQPAMIEPPPLLVGHQLSVVLRLRNTDFEYARSEQSLPGRPFLRVAVPAERHPQAVGWVSSSDMRGRVLLTVDGRTVSRSLPGGFASGVLLAPRRSHLVTVTATRPTASTRLGLAFYQWPTP